MISATESLADLDELQAEELTREEHRHLSRDGEHLRSRLGLESLDRHCPFVRDTLLNESHTILSR
jgi:hypothetical protein